MQEKYHWNKIFALVFFLKNRWQSLLKINSPQLPTGGEGKWLLIFSVSWSAEALPPALERTNLKDLQDNESFSFAPGGFCFFDSLWQFKHSLIQQINYKKLCSRILLSIPNFLFWNCLTICSQGSSLLAEEKYGDQWPKRIVLLVVLCPCHGCCDTLHL